MDETQFSQESLQWFAMRDLKRRHAKLPAYKLFENLKVRYFTPMVHRLVVVNGKRVDQEVPFMQDLLFVRHKSTPRPHCREQPETAISIQNRCATHAHHRTDCRYGTFHLCR